MDAELRDLVHRLAADPGDARAGSALAQALVRREGPARAGVEPVPVPPELAPGVAALVVRASRPRALFAWPRGLDAAIGRVGRVLAVAADRLSCEVGVAGVGRFHAGAASLFLVPGEGTAPSVADLERVTSADPGELGRDGLTEAQRTLLACVPEREPESVAAVARAAGFVAENNRDAAGADEILSGLHDACWRVGVQVLEIGRMEYLGGAAELGPEVRTGPAGLGWTSGPDRWVNMASSGRAAIAGLPLALVGGLRTEALRVPSHEPREVVRALQIVLDRPTATVAEVMGALKGPHFLGGAGEVGPAEAVRALYETGRGTLRLRATIELQLPSRIHITIPDPDALHSSGAFAEAIEDAVRASRLDGLETADPALIRERLLVHVVHGAVGLVRRQLRELLPLEWHVEYCLPMPLVDWLRAFIDDKRALGLSDAQIRRTITAARPSGPVKRRTSIA